VETLSVISRGIALGLALLLAPCVHGQGIWNYTGPIYSFGSQVSDADGNSPNGGVLVSADGSTLYGTTVGGGAHGNGTVFAFDLTSQQIQTLWDFGNIPGDGAAPQGNLVMANGFLFGTTQSGGTYGLGTVYKIDPIGQEYYVIYSFGTTFHDGNYPTTAGLTVSADGSTLYGTTAFGGANSNGAVFSLSSFEGQNYQILHQFTIDPNGQTDYGDGQVPEAGLLLSADGTTLYGTTYAGGDANNDGTVFALSTQGDAAYYQVLHRFLDERNNDGSGPMVGLIISSDGTTLYGTTATGGVPFNFEPDVILPPGGTVFSIGTNGANYTILNSFHNQAAVGEVITDGINPYAGLVMSGNWLYGTTYAGGTTTPGAQAAFYDSGSVFAVSVTGASQASPGFDDQLYAFESTNNPKSSTADGANPGASLMYQNASPYPILFGTTTAGGANNVGTLFSLTQVTPPMMFINPIFPSSIHINYQDPTFTFNLQSAAGLRGPWTSIGQGLTNYTEPITNLRYYQLVAFVTNPPAVTTLAASGVSANDATLNGTVVPDAPTAMAWFQWGVDTNYSGGSSATVVVPAYMSNAIALSNSLSGLVGGTTYHYQLVASNIDGIAYGNDQTFSTPAGAVAPTATTLAAVGATSNTATLTGGVSANGATTLAYFQFGATMSYGSQTSSARVRGADTNTVRVSNAVAMLLPGTIYHFQLVAVNSVGTNYGGDQVFATLGPPGASTAPAAAVMATSATLNGYVVPDAANTLAWFEYGLDTNYTGGITAFIPVSETNIYGLEVSNNLSGLASNTVYHFQLVASNSAGVSYGGDEYFTTPLGPLPEVTTDPATNVTATTATLTGTVNPDGIATMAYFYYYSPEDGTYGITPSQSAGSGTTAVNLSATVTNLEQNTLYYYLIAATNTVGSGATNGAYVSFMTGRIAFIARPYVSLPGGRVERDWHRQWRGHSLLTPDLLAAAPSSEKRSQPVILTTGRAKSWVKNRGEINLTPWEILLHYSFDKPFRLCAGSCGILF
jgi:uncharacterized repeat protein (TIGR03803 family)